MTRSLFSDSPADDAPLQGADDARWFRHTLYCLRAMPDLAREFRAVMERLRVESPKGSYWAALANLVAAIRPELDTSRGMRKERAARMAWQLVEPHLQGGVLVAVWDEGRVLIATDGPISADAVRRVLEPLTNGGAG